MFNMKNLLKAAVTCCGVIMFGNISNAYGDGISNVDIAGSKDKYIARLKQLSDSDLNLEKEKLESTVYDAELAKTQLGWVKEEQNNRGISAGSKTSQSSANAGGNTSSASVLAPSGPAEVKTQVTTDNNGEKKTEEETHNLGASGESANIPATGDSGTSASGDSIGAASNVTADNKNGSSSSVNKQNGAEQKQSEVAYSGVYKDHQIIPNLMAIHCKVNAEDIVKDLSLLEKCLKQYVTEMNNSNASAKETAMKDYNNLRYATINDNLAVAITKSASVAGYEEKMNEYAEATSKADTKFDMEASLSNTQAFSTDVMNSIRELYAEMLKYEAINGLIDVDPDAIVDEGEKKSEKGKYLAKVETKTNGQTVEVKAGITDKDAKDGGELPEVTVVGSSKLDKYEQMTPEEFARHKDEVAALKAELTATMQSGDASDSEISGAQKALDRLSEIEAQKASWGGTDDFAPVD